MKTLHHAAVANCLAGIAMLGTSPAGFAQGNSDNGIIEELVVTATKREQSIQEVPIAVSAYNAELLRAAGVTDLRELTQLSPSLFLSSSASETAGAVARIRGIGTTGDNPGLESSVAVFIDGVYRNRTNVGLTELGPLDRVEVLRGPQGTLFGRNASAGLINIITAAPTEETTGYAELSAGNYGYGRLGAGIAGRLGDDGPGARLDLVYTQRDGYLEDSVTGEDYNDRDRYLVRGHLWFEPSDKLEIKLSTDFSKREETCCAAVAEQAGATAAIIQYVLGGQMPSGGSADDPDPYSRNSATTPGRGYQQDVDEWGVSVDVEWELDNANFTSITALRDWEADRSQDIDYTSADILYRAEDTPYQEFKTFTQEFRLQGEAGKVDWLVGLYYADEDLTINDAVRLGEDGLEFADALVRAQDPTFPGYTALMQLVTMNPAAVAMSPDDGVVADVFEQNSTNYAIFTHNIFHVTDKMDFTLGLRHTEEEKTLDANFTTQNPTCSTLMAAVGAGALPASVLQLPCLPFFNPLVDGVYNDGSREESVTSGTLALNYIWSDTFSGYVSYSRGYKAGGFNLDRAGLVITAPDLNEDLQFEEETVDSYEVGFKYQSDDRSVQVNTALFHSVYDDFQLNTFNGIAFVVENLPEVETNGLEVEANWYASDMVTLAGGFSWIDAEYGSDFEGDIFAAPSPTNPAGGALWQLPGETLTNAPELSVTGSSTFKTPLTANLMGSLHLDFRYTSEVNTGSDLDLEKEQGDVFIANARFGIGSPEGKWDVELWVRNLFDEDYAQVIFDGPLQGSGTERNTVLPNTQTFYNFAAEPRTFGLSLRTKF